MFLFLAGVRCACVCVYLGSADDLVIEPTFVSKSYRTSTMMSGSAFFRGLLTTALIATTTTAQFVTPPRNLTTKQGHFNTTVRYKSVPPGICELDPSVKSYSGYADISSSEHIFWWFFEARRPDPENAPLTIWINGGPGSSSMIGLFQELGPCGVDPDLKPFNNPYSWTNVSNMLFIDQPSMVGFSYSDPVVPGYKDSGYIIELPTNECPDYVVEKYGGCGTYSRPDMTRTVNSTTNAADGMWRTLQGFLGVFPQYGANGVNFATESYGGHYAPIFNAYILDQNAKNLPTATHIDLQSVLIGNGWFDPLVQYAAYYNFTITPSANTYDLPPPNETVRAEWYNNMYGPGNCYDQTVQCNETGRDDVCSRAHSFCSDKVENVFDIYTGDRDEYDVRYLTPDPFPYSYYVEYLNQPSIQAAIGAYQNFSESSRSVSAAFDSTGDDTREMGIIAANKKLLDASVQVVHYYGDADYICNWIGGEVVADEVNAAGYKQAGFVDFATSDGVTHGQVKQAGLFSFVRVYEAGHEVPFYQPELSLALLERALNGTDIAMGLIPITAPGKNGTYTPIYTTKGTPKSTFREGNKTVQYEITPKNATYNTKLNAPDPVPTWGASAGAAASASGRADKLRKGRMRGDRRFG